MIGYSASNKESGIVRSRWLLRQAQESLFAAADAAGIDLTLFHGQADGVDRGGGRTEVLVRSGPNGARRGRLRITEQGELINEKYGLRPIALRVFEQAFNALSLSRTGVMPPERVEPHWREAMELLGNESSRVYRGTVFEDPDFHEFFCQITPIDVVERMQIGSRPVSRVERVGIAALRSIPWWHAWSQCRYMMPGWYGAGSALALASRTLGDAALRDMYENWFFFTNLIDDIELSLARADLGIAAAYEQLVDEKLRRFIPVLRAEYELTRQQVLNIRWLHAAARRRIDRAAFDPAAKSVHRSHAPGASGPVTALARRQTGRSGIAVGVAGHRERHQPGAARRLTSHKRALRSLCLVRYGNNQLTMMS